MRPALILSRGGLSRAKSELCLAFAYPWLLQFANTISRIITPTIIEAVSFRAWQTEVFDIWREWTNVFHPSSPSARLLDGLRNDVWLVNVIGHDYIDAKKFWDLLLQP